MDDAFADAVDDTVLFDDGVTVAFLPLLKLLLIVVVLNNWFEPIIP